MKYYLIYSELQNKDSTPAYIVERRDTAEHFCSKFVGFTFIEKESGQYTFTTPGTISLNSPITVEGDFTTIQGQDLSTSLEIPYDKICQQTDDLYSRIKCPHCGAQHFEVGGSWTTAEYHPIIYKDGKLLDTGHATTTTTYYCLACGKSWEIKE